MEVPPNPHTPEELHDRRMLAAALFEAGEHSQAQIARMLGVSRQAAHQWHKAWTKGGTNALTPGPIKSTKMAGADLRGSDLSNLSGLVSLHSAKVTEIQLRQLSEVMIRDLDFPIAEIPL